jgi:hypothetical protein
VSSTRPTEAAPLLASFRGIHFCLRIPFSGQKRQREEGGVRAGGVQAQSA